MLGGRSLALFLFAAVLLWGGAERVLATTLEPMGLEKLSKRSPVVVWGKVLEITKDKNSGKRTALLSVLEEVKGDVPSQIKIELLDYVSGDKTWVMKVPMSMELFLDEEVLLFLNKKSNEDIYVPVGLRAGKYRVVEDEYKVRRALSWSSGPINKGNVDHFSSIRGLTAPRLQNERVVEKAPKLTNLIDQVRAHQ